MYNDEKNLYHYTYRKDGSETAEPTLGQRLQDQSGLQRPVQEMKPVKKNRLGLKMVALALICALLGGAAGGGGVYWAMNAANTQHPSQGQTETVPEETPAGVSASPVTVHQIDGATLLTDAEVYAANVNSVVSINTGGTAGYNRFGQQVPFASAGSGFVLTADGFIATNYHVIENAETVKVTLYNGDTYDARIVNGEEDYDIAVLKIDAEGLQPVTIGDSSTLNVGDRVLAIGNPLGELTFSMTGGMVSCVNRAINVDSTPFNMIQTDAPINPGNSGGPMFNQYGQVVGIVTAKYSSTSSGENAEGLGFAIPINDVFAMIKDIMTNGYVANHPYLGITPMSMTAQMAAQYHYDVTEGVFISYVEPDSAAAAAGLRMGDVITKLDNISISTVDDLNLAKKQYTAGQNAVLEVYRQGERLTVSFTWGAMPAQENPQQEEQAVVIPDTGSSGQYGNGYVDPFDMFDYFFGTRNW